MVHRQSGKVYTYAIFPEMLLNGNIYILDHQLLRCSKIFPKYIEKLSKKNARSKIIVFQLIFPINASYKIKNTPLSRKITKVKDKLPLYQKILEKRMT